MWMVGHLIAERSWSAHASISDTDGRPRGHRRAEHDLDSRGGVERRTPARRQATNGRHHRHGAGRPRLARSATCSTPTSSTPRASSTPAAGSTGPATARAPSSSCPTASTTRRRRRGGGPAPGPSRTRCFPRTRRSIRTCAGTTVTTPARPGCGRMVKVGNIDFEGEMSAGHPRLEPDPESPARPRSPAALPAGMGWHEHDRPRAQVDRGTVLRTPQWHRIQQAVSAKAVILASGFQDETYADYIAPSWPADPGRGSVGRLRHLGLQLRLDR